MINSLDAHWLWKNHLPIGKHTEASSELEVQSKIVIPPKNRVRRFPLKHAYEFPKYHHLDFLSMPNWFPIPEGYTGLHHRQWSIVMFYFLLYCEEIYL